MKELFCILDEYSMQKMDPTPNMLSSKCLHSICISGSKGAVQPIFLKAMRKLVHKCLQKERV